MYLTTTQVAKICEVAPRTVAKWFDSGQLKGYRIPGGRLRRIPEKVLFQFMVKNSIPLDRCSFRRNILIIGGDKTLAEKFLKFLPVSEGFSCEATTSKFEAGFKVANLYPKIVVIEFAMGLAKAIEIIHYVREALKDTLFIALTESISFKDDQLTRLELLELGFSEVFRKPFDIALLARRIRTLIN